MYPDHAVFVFHLVSTVWHPVRAVLFPHRRETLVVIKDTRRYQEALCVSVVRAKVTGSDGSSDFDTSRGKRSRIRSRFTSRCSKLCTRRAFSPVQQLQTRSVHT